MKTCLCEVFGFCFVWPGLVWPRSASPAPARPSPSLPSPDRPSPGLPRPSSEQPSRTLAAPVLRFRYAGQGWSGRAQKIGFQVSIRFFIKKTWKPSPETRFSCFSSVFPKYTIKANPENRFSGFLVVFQKQKLKTQPMPARTRALPIWHPTFD